MDKETLRRVQLTQLKIAEEIKRVCDENHIQYFLDSGTLLGAVRHDGFIPWDDDMDIGMTRDNYEKFRKIAPQKLDPAFAWQDWHNDSDYPLPFGKVRLRNTVYVEGKAKKLKENGFYVDVFPYDNAPENPADRRKLADRLTSIERKLLMKSGYQPWYEDGKINMKKRAAYSFYQIAVAFKSHKSLVHDYEEVVKSVPYTGEYTYEQDGTKHLYLFKEEWIKDVIDKDFEGITFSIPKHYKKWLRSVYGDYMKLPPKDQRENRHMIVEIDFGKY